MTATARAPNFAPPADTLMLTISIPTNVVLHELDRLWEDRCTQLGQLIRYADDGAPRRLKEGSM
jgi:hypothetical protein